MALLTAVCASLASAGDKPQPPKLPLAEWWTVSLDGPVGAAPASDGTRIYVALRTGELTARDAADGHELWRIKKDVTTPMMAGGDLVIVAAGEAIEAIRGANGKSAWVLPRTTPVAPLLLDKDILFVTTDTEIVAVRAATGEVMWRHAAGGVRLPLAIDGDQVYTGAQDGRVLALKRGDGTELWQKFFTGGVTALGARNGLVYVGAGDKVLYCLSARKGEESWPKHLGANAVGRIAVDDDRVYVAAYDNVVYGLDRKNGNQRWHAGLHQRPVFGVFLFGHIIFIAAAANQIGMLYDLDGRPSGTLTLPGDVPPNLVPAILDGPDGPVLFAVTGGLTNEWYLTKFAPAGEAVLLPLAQMDPFPGLPYLTDPELTPLANVLRTLLVGDPVLLPFADVSWPVVLRDPPLMPLTVLPGLQLRPLSPVLPVRREASGPGD